MVGLLEFPTSLAIGRTLSLGMLLSTVLATYHLLLLLLSLIASFIFSVESKSLAYYVI